MRLAILDDYEDVALQMGDWESLGADVEVDVYRDHEADETLLVDRLLPYDILVIMRERTPFQRKLIEQLPNLKLLITSGIRNRAIDLTACAAKGIVVSGTESGKNAAAEQAYQALEGMLTKQAMLITYRDIFIVLGIFFLACIPFVMLIKVKKSAGGTAPAPLH